MNILFLGAPGSGKGTQAIEISNHFAITHLSTGDIFRQNIKDQTELGLKAKAIITAGKLVDDDLTSKMVEDTLKSNKFDNGVLLDGFPRTLYQVELLDKILSRQNKKLKKVILLNIDQTLLLERITGRRSCPKCKSTYHIKFSQPKIENICDMCGTELVHRSDDQAEKVEVRLNAYNKQTLPLIKLYKSRNILATVDASMKMEDVTKSIIKKLDL